MIIHGATERAIFVPMVVARHLVAVARRPDDVRIGRIGNGEAGLAAAERRDPRTALRRDRRLSAAGPGAAALFATASGDVLEPRIVPSSCMLL